MKSDELHIVCMNDIVDYYLFITIQIEGIGMGLTLPLICRKYSVDVFNFANCCVPNVDKKYTFKNDIKKQGRGILTG